MELFPFHLLFGLIVGLIARSKGRNALGWGIFGLFLHFIALLAVVLVANLNDPEARRRRAERAWEKERERLEPQLAATRAPEAVSESLPRTWGQLGTPAAGPPGPSAPQPLVSSGLPPRLPEDVPPLGEERAWYFEENGRARGPEPESAVRMKLVQGDLAGDTLVWAAGMDEWTPADTRAEFLA